MDKETQIRNLLTSAQKTCDDWKKSGKATRPGQHYTEGHCDGQLQLIDCILHILDKPV